MCDFFGPWSLCQIAYSKLTRLAPVCWSFWRFFGSDRRNNPFRRNRSSRFVSTNGWRCGLPCPWTSSTPCCDDPRESFWDAEGRRRRMHRRRLHRHRRRRDSNEPNSYAKSRMDDLPSSWTGRKNEWMKEWMNEWMNEWKNKLMNEQINERLNE